MHDSRHATRASPSAISTDQGMVQDTTQPALRLTSKHYFRSMIEFSVSDSKFQADRMSNTQLIHYKTCKGTTRAGAKVMEVIARGGGGGGEGEGGNASGGDSRSRSVNAIVHNDRRRRFETEDGEAFLEYHVISAGPVPGPGFPQQATKRSRRSGARESGSLQSDGDNTTESRTHDTADYTPAERTQSETAENRSQAKSVLNLRHTYVPPRKRGLGLAASLCFFAFDFAKKNNLVVLPTCSYIKDTFLPQHPEFQDIVVADLALVADVSPSRSPSSPPSPVRPSRGHSQGRRPSDDGQYGKKTENERGSAGSSRSRRSMRPAL
ncbi:hypothetical protein CBR_g36233 [Chara braunii]|uniref:N-acetyltransferase domain-containing protein n=1 Tax=Chara braunii TaxID=69332 RepID=A0A388LKE9_CHABU|nr:hypothetical protein CBR_g36233 [Chara braunii]|eukprot:GBG82703.1 hypothetical protein CBR_g36233 [Chara braunii]